MIVVITKLERHLIPKAKIAPRGITATTLLLFAICLCSCLPERFRHEKYDCSGSLQNINTIVINKAKTGNYAKIVSPARETKANIIQIDEQTAWLNHKNMQMKINRKTGTLTIVHGTKYMKVDCEKTVFKM